jgi:hypothetical protein
VVHAVQLVDPTVAHLYEHDQTTARQTRIALLDAAVAAGALLGTAHLGDPFMVVPAMKPAR